MKNPKQHSLFYNLKHLHPVLYWHIGLAICLSILVIESLFMVLSVRSRRQQLEDIRQELSADLAEKTGEDFSTVHPGVLSDEYIDLNVNQYMMNILGISLVISAFGCASTLLVFHCTAGRHLLAVIDANKKCMPAYGWHQGQKFEKYQVPNNEIGDLIDSRNRMLELIFDFQGSLEEKLNEAKSQLLHQARLSSIGEFTAGIIHDIRNPLTSILLEAECVEDPELKTSIRKSANQIKVLVDRMAKFSYKDMQMEDDLDLSEVLEDAVQFTKSKWASARVKMIQHYPPHLKCHGNSVALNQVFCNLITNASDALRSSDRRELEIKVVDEGPVYQISFQDTGCGISDEHLEHIYDAFYTSKPSNQGTGLGLSTCQKILDLHDTALTYSPNPGGGSIFRFQISKSRPS